MTAQVIPFTGRLAASEPAPEKLPCIDIYDVAANALGTMSLSLTEDGVTVCKDETQRDLVVIHQMLMGLVERSQGKTTSNTKLLDYMSNLRNIAFK